METKPVSHRVRKPADEQFGFGVDSPNARHNRASLLGAKNICHDVILAPRKQDGTAVERSLRLLGQNPGADYSRGPQGQNRTARLEARIAPEALAVVRRAAEIHGRSVTDFVVAAAQEAANRATEETEIIRLSLHGQRRLAALLLNPHQPPEYSPRLCREIQCPAARTPHRDTADVRPFPLASWTLPRDSWPLVPDPWPLLPECAQSGPVGNIAVKAFRSIRAADSVQRPIMWSWPGTDRGADAVFPGRTEKTRGDA